MLYALLIWNAIVFFIYGIDKYKAKAGKWRISEKFLLFCAFLLGGIGAALGMSLFRHKTRHLSFQVLVPLAILVNIAALYFYFKFTGTAFLELTF